MTLTQAVVGTDNKAPSLLIACVSGLVVCVLFLLPDYVCLGMRFLIEYGILR